MLVVSCSAGVEIAVGAPYERRPLSARFQTPRVTFLAAALRGRSLGVSDQARLPLYREHRTLLRDGQWQRVVEELTDLAQQWVLHRQDDHT